MKATKHLMRYGRGTTPLGEAVVFLTDKGVRALRLVDRGGVARVLQEMSQASPGVRYEEDAPAAERAFRQVEQWLAGKLPATQLQLDMEGTPFQRTVWKELLRVPHGQTWSYSELAQRVGKPRAVRAVASACARNPIGLLVPCHRVVRQDGSLGGYYWGLEKKRRLLDHERTRAGDMPLSK